MNDICAILSKIHRNLMHLSTVYRLLECNFEKICENSEDV